MFSGLTVLVLVIASCYGSVPYVRKFENSGGGAVRDWDDKFYKVHGRYSSKSEHEAYTSQLKGKVEQYLAANADIAERKKSQLRTLTPHKGMTKNEVRLFLNGPVAVSRDLKVMAEQAGSLWPRLQGAVDESWAYEPYTYYFAGEVLVYIVHRMPAYQPL